MTSSAIPRTRRTILAPRGPSIGKSGEGETRSIFTARPYPRDRVAILLAITEEEGETLDVEEAVRCLNEALRLQYRYTLAAGGMFGFEYQGFWSELAAPAPSRGRRSAPRRVYLLRSPDSVVLSSCSSAIAPPEPPVLSPRPLG